jgi:hypothetical protein
LRSSGNNAYNLEGKDIFGVNFHDFIKSEAAVKQNMELASEFGISLGEVKKLRKYLENR